MKAKLQELMDTLKSNGYTYPMSTLKEIGSYADLEGAYTFLIYFAKRIKPALVKGHKLPEVTHSMVICSRCGGEGGADKWNHTGRTCYNCSGQKRVLGSQVAFRKEMKSLAENAEIVTIEVTKEKATNPTERTIKVEYFVPVKPEAYETHEFKLSEIPVKTWAGVESFVAEKLGLSLQVRNKTKTKREYRDYCADCRFVRILL